MKTANELLREQEVHQVHIGGIVYEMVKITQAEKAMEAYRKQGRFYTPAEIRVIQDAAYDAGLAASFSEG